MRAAAAPRSSFCPLSERVLRGLRRSTVIGAGMRNYGEYSPSARPRVPRPRPEAARPVSAQIRLRDKERHGARATASNSPWLFGAAWRREARARGLCRLRAAVVGGAASGRAAGDRRRARRRGELRLRARRGRRPRGREGQLARARRLYARRKLGARQRVGLSGARTRGRVRSTSLDIERVDAARLRARASESAARLHVPAREQGPPGVLRAPVSACGRIARAQARWLQSVRARRIASHRARRARPGMRSRQRGIRSATPLPAARRPRRSREPAPPTQHACARRQPRRCEMRERHEPACRQRGGRHARTSANRRSTVGAGRTRARRDHLRLALQGARAARANRTRAERSHWPL